MTLTSRKDCVPAACDPQPFVRAARLWGIGQAVPRFDLELAGSPERCLQRCVVQDDDGDLWVLEGIAPQATARKVVIAQTLTALVDHGLSQLIPYRTTPRGEYLPYYGGQHWQLQRYRPGVPLPRPGWVDEAWRGQELARFLLALRRVSSGLVLPGAAGALMLSGYVDELVGTIRTRRPDLAVSLSVVCSYLEVALWSQEPSLATAFCHGDYHPLNIIWEPTEIGAIIDWEFCGNKPALYDLANLLGCVGIEQPAGLEGPLVRSLLAALGAGDYLCAPSWAALPAYVLALRFAWLSEWLRRDDGEMIALELDYMHLLHGAQSELCTIWRRFRASPSPQ